MDTRGSKKNQNAFTCHAGPVEVIKNFFCGSEFEARDMASAKIRVDTLISLSVLDASIWDDLGFRGEILYCPIKDYGTLPDNVLDDLVSKILDRLGRGKKIGLFCMGGHGRTGYIASIVLGRLGYEDPIGFLRSNYCVQAVESSAQIQHIAEVLGNPILEQTYKTKNAGFVHDLLSDSFIGYDFGAGDSPAELETYTCGKCACFRDGMCQVFKVFTPEDEFACECFSDE